MLYDLQSRVRVLLIFVFACAFSTSAFAQDWPPYCDPMVGMLSDDFTPSRLSDVSAAAEAARAKVETSPFPNVCQDPELFKNRPPTGLFRRAAPLTDSAGHSSADLLKRIGARVLESMSQEELRLSVMEKCLNGNMSAKSPACLDVRKYIDQEIQPMVHAARMNLALAQTVGEIRTAALQQANPNANTALNSLGTQKETAWDALGKQETENAKLILQQYKSESETEAARLIGLGKLQKKDVARFVDGAVLSSRFTHGLEYVELLSRYPMLQYLKSEKPSDTEIMQVVSKMRKHLAADKAYAEKALRAANETSSYGSVRGVRYKNGPLTEINPDALPLLDFTTHVESVLQESPEFCGLAASLQYTKENRSIGNGLAIGVPLIVATFALPVIGQATAGVVLGGVSGVGYAISSKFDRNQAADRFISKLNADSNEDYAKLDQADREFKISLALGPVAMAAGPTVRTVSVGLRATRFGAFMASKSLKAGKLATEAVEAGTAGTK